MPSALTQVGAYPITGTGKLPNVDIASPGEVWSRKRASGIIVPGSLVKPVLVSTVGSLAVVAEGDTILQPESVTKSDSTHISENALAIAMRQVMIPDINVGSLYNQQLGPNEIVNLPIASGDYLRSYHSGVVNLTLVVPGAYKEGEILGWNPKGTRPVGKTEGEGAWGKVSEANIVAGTGILIIDAPPRVYGSAEENLLTCRFLRANQ